MYVHCLRIIEVVLSNVRFANLPVASADGNQKQFWTGKVGWGSVSQIRFIDGDLPKVASPTYLHFLLRVIPRKFGQE